MVRWSISNKWKFLRIPNFEDTTGYVSADSLGGYGCRHSFFHGISIRTYSKNEYKNYASLYTNKGMYGPSQLTISDKETQEIINKYDGTEY